jgi:hypothetical protein
MHKVYLLKCSTLTPACQVWRAGNAGVSRRRLLGRSQAGAGGHAERAVFWARNARRERAYMGAHIGDDAGKLYAAVCSRMQPYAAVCSRMQPYAASTHFGVS